MNNVFDILGIVPTTELQLVSTAYEDKFLQLHPARKDSNTVKLQALRDAYELVNEQSKLNQYYQHQLFKAEKQTLRDLGFVHSAKLSRAATNKIAPAMPNRPIMRESTSMPGLIVMSVFTQTAQESAPRVHQVDLTDFIHENRHRFVSAESTKQCFLENYGEAISQGDILNLVKNKLVTKGIVLSKACLESDCDKMVYSLPQRPILKLSDSAPGEIEMAVVYNGQMKRRCITAYIHENYLSLLMADDLKQAAAKIFGKIICLDEFNQHLAQLCQAAQLLNASGMVQPSTLSRAKSEVLARAFPEKLILRQSTSQVGMIAVTLCYKGQIQQLSIDDLIIHNPSHFTCAESALTCIEEGLFLFCKSKWEVFSEANSGVSVSDCSAGRLKIVTPQEIIEFEHEHEHEHASSVADNYEIVERPSMT